MLRTRIMAATIACATVATLIVMATPAAQRASAPSPPKLLVLLVVDQMRADYVDRFGMDWTAGLRRLVSQGAWFRNAAYPYLTTVTCSGHATIATGAFPRAHGVIQNEWPDPERRRWLWCVDDPSSPNIGYLKAAGGGNSARQLLVPTLADELKTRKSARVVSVSLKADAAIMLAGKGGDAVTWIDGASLDRLVTSTAFTPRPVPAVQTFVTANAIEAYFRRTWDRLLPAASYRERDDAPGEMALPGWTTQFPHPLNGRRSEADLEFRVQWSHSPFVDEYVGRLAAALVESLQLGKRNTTDVLAISFSATDEVGHVFGPRSQEVQDTLARLDRTIGTLLGRLDASVGADQYVVALSSDHGVTAIPEQATREGRDAGRIDPLTIAEQVEARLITAWGRGRYVAALSGSNMNLYFLPGVYDRLRGSPPTLEAVLQTVRQIPGVQRVLRAEDARDGVNSSDPLVRAAALSYYAGRSGDLIVVLKPGWNATANAAMHGNGTPDDQRVPILLMGPGIKPGQYSQAATPADIAPTLASLAAVTLPRADGRILREALD